jgi:Lon protease-like protein
MNIPSRIPAMTLRDVVLFPQAMLPLRIFEDRYKKMLSDVLNQDRIFAVVAERDQTLTDDQLDEPPFEVATAGLIRVSKENEDGTSFVMLQGLSRVRIRSINDEGPYRILKVEPLETIIEKDTKEYRNKIYDALVQNKLLGGEVSKDILDYLETIEDDAAFIDLAAFTLCKNTIRKQAMLEVQRLHKRAEMLFDDLMQENLQLSVWKQSSLNQDSMDLDRN